MPRRLSAAAGSPLIAAWLLDEFPGLLARPNFCNLAGLTALLISPLIAFRTGRLIDYLIGPPIGLLAGYLDLHAMLWLYQRAGWPMWAAALAPVWSAVLALWVAWRQPTWRKRTVAFFVIVLVDLALHAFWMKVDHGMFMTEFEVETEEVAADDPFMPAISDIRLFPPEWVLNGFVYAPTAVLAVLLACRSKPLAPSAGCVGAAFDAELVERNAAG